MDCTDKMTDRVSESPPLSSKSEWTSVLHLSHAWNFPSMRSLAVRQLSPLTTPVDRVVIGRKYNIEHWLRPAYEAICEREEWLSEAEGERLGLRDVLRIGRARQLLRAPAILREEGERRALLGGVFGDHPSSTADDVPPSRLTSVWQDSSVQPSISTSSPVSTEHMESFRDIESLRVPEVATAITDASRDASSHMPTDDHYEAALGPVYAPVTSSLRDQLLTAVYKIDSAEEAMSRARVDHQTAAEEEANAKADWSAYYSDNRDRALIRVQGELSRAQRVISSATTSLESAYNSFVVTVSPYCPSLAKAYRITPEARKELASMISVLTAAEQSANTALHAKRHIEYCKANEALCARTYATSRTEENEGSLRHARSEVHAAVAHAQKQEQQEQDAKDMLARAHLALAAYLSKLLTSAIVNEETATEAV
jgi:hypothetical protein